MITRCPPRGFQQLWIDSAVKSITLKCSVKLIIFGQVLYKAVTSAPPFGCKRPYLTGWTVRLSRFTGTRYFILNYKYLSLRSFCSKHVLRKNSKPNIFCVAGAGFRGPAAAAHLPAAGHCHGGLGRVLHLGWAHHQVHTQIAQSFSSC